MSESTPLTGTGNRGIVPSTKRVLEIAKRHANFILLHDGVVLDPKLVLHAEERRYAVVFLRSRVIKELLKDPRFTLDSCAYRFGITHSTVLRALRHDTSGRCPSLT